jgi:gentisate 1,2-dioxygenase
VDYVNPETGADVLPTMGFTAMMIAAGTIVSPPRRSCSSAFHVVAGRGRTIIDGQAVEWGPKDTFSAPVFAKLSHEAEEEAFLVRIHDRPLQEKLGYYEEWE